MPHGMPQSLIAFSSPTHWKCQFWDVRWNHAPTRNCFIIILFVHVNSVHECARIENLTNKNGI